MKFIRIILFPIVPIYFLVTWFRNVFYDVGIFSSKSYEVPVICVGNLSTGGTGKTPMIEYLIRLLKGRNQLATLSRGYKRSTQGFVLANSKSNAMTIGDEPFQFYRKFNDVNIAVDANRQNGIQKLLELEHRPEVILLDDAYQHRKVKAGLNILLTSYQHPFYKDIVLPTGNLREPRSGAKRANIIIVTKCPKSISENDRANIIKKIKKGEKQEVFFSHIAYAEEVISHNSTQELVSLTEFTLVTGIADASPLVRFLNSKGLKFDHKEYPDHHIFSSTEIEMLTEKKLIITTEKDYVRLSENLQLKDKLFYLPMEFKLDRAKEFNDAILNFTN